MISFRVVFNVYFRVVFAFVLLFASTSLNAADGVDAAVPASSSLEALEGTGIALVREGRFHEADRVYSRLLRATLTNPAEAIRHAFVKWHLRQGYQAQASMIRAARIGGLTVGNADLVRRTLAEVYDEQNVIRSLRREFTNPADAEALAELERFWNEACRRMRLFEEQNDSAGLREYAGALFGDGPASLYHAVWRAYALVYGGNPDAAVAELNFALQSGPDEQAEAAIIAGLRLVREFRRSALSNDLLNRVAEVVSGVSSSVGEQISDSYASVAEKFDRAESLIRDGDFAAAGAELETLRSVFLDTEQRAKYIYLLAETQWGQEEFARANQGYVAALVASRDRYTQSGALVRMAEYASMAGRREDAASYAARSAAALPDQAWKLRQVGSLFIGLGLPERGISYLERALDLSDSLEGDAATYSELAEGYKRAGERAKYLKTASDYIGTVREIGAGITPEQDGLRAYYQAELLLAEGKADAAHEAFEHASGLITDRFRLAEIFMNLAEYNAGHENPRLAIEQAERSVELLPDQDWKLRQGGEFLLRMGEREKAFSFLERALETARSPAGTAASLSALAQANGSVGDETAMLRYAREYIAFEAANREALSEAEAGLSAFYRAEILSSEGRTDQAYDEYAGAVDLIAENFRKSDIYMKMAEIQARRGSREQAAALAGQSAEALPDGWKLRQVGDFLIRLDMPDKALEYFTRYVETTSAPDARTSVLATMADAYLGQGNRDRFLHFARQYIMATAAAGRKPSNAEMGLSAFYQAEINAAEGKPDEAFTYYEIAAGLLEDDARLSEAFMRMAEYEAARGRKEEAALLAGRSVEARPEAWRLQQAGDLLMRLGMPDKAFEYLERYASAQSASVRDRAAIYATMADAYRDQGNRERYLHYAGEYVRAMTAGGQSPSRAEEGLVAFYQGEIYSSRNENDRAYASYERAATLLEDKTKASDSYLRMAEALAARGDSEQAAVLAGKSAEELPDAWKQRQVGEFLLRLGMPDEAFEYLSRAAGSGASSDNGASVYRAMADAYDAMGEREQYLRFAEEYVRAVEAEGRAPTAAEEGIAAYYRGEILSSRGEDLEAYQAYERASRLLTDRGRLAAAYMKMAEYQAGRDNKELAAELARQSAFALPQEWKMRQVGNFLLNQGMPDEALALFERYAGEAGSGASGYSVMADAYKARGDTGQYLHFAQRYIDAITAGERTPSKAENGLAEFYRGEILAAANQPEQAYAAFGRAAEMLEDRNRAADAFMRMAEMQRERGDEEAAAALVEKSVAVVPDQDWRALRAGDFLLGLDRREKAFEYFDRVLSRNPSPRDRAAAYRSMAESYKKNGDGERYLRYAREFVDAVSSADYMPTRDERAAAAYYQGEILAGRGDAAAAYHEYERAAELASDQFLLADLYMKMAEYRAEQGDRDEAVAFAEKAAALPEQDWKLQQIGELYNRMEMPGKALDYFGRVLRQSKSPRMTAIAHSALAEVYNKMNDPERFLLHAVEYVSAVESRKFTPSREEDALRYYYQGEIDASRDEPDAAYQAYEHVVRLSSDKFRLSDAYIRMARYQAKKGDRDKAVDYAERALELLPDQGWRVMEVGDVYSGLDLTARAIEYYQEAVRLTPVTGDRAAAYTALAEAHKKLDDRAKYVEYARLYVGALAAREGDVSNNEKALSLFYRGESAAFDGDEDGAYRLWDEAAALFTDAFRLSDIAMKQAEYQAERKNMQAATELAEKSAALIPDQAWRQKGTGDFFSNQDMMDKALLYYGKALDLSKTPETRAVAYAALADAYRKLKNEEMYIAMARQYLSSLQAKAEEPTRAEKAQYGFYLGEIFTAENDPDQAYAAYEYAAQFITDDPYRLSEVLMNMAKYNAKRGNRELAAGQAERAADLLPDKVWRIQEVVGVLGDVGHYREAEAVAERAVAMNPGENMTLYKALSSMHSQARNRQRSLDFNTRFIDLLTDKVRPMGALAPRADLDELWNARDRQNGATRQWGLDSYYFGKRWPRNDNYFLGMSHELFRYFSLPIGIGGKVYAQFGGTMTAKYSGYYLDVVNSQLREWESRPRLPDTSHFILGAEVNPFRGAFMSSVTVGAEYLLGTGRDMENDFRIRLGVDKTVGEKPKPYGRYWKYWKTYVDTIYSTRYDDVTSTGDYRLGVTLSTTRDSNLLVIPHAILTHTYGGKTVDKGQRWGFDVGAGVAVRKWFREDKYNTPRSYVELHVYYHHALTHERHGGPGFTLSTSF